MDLGSIVKDLRKKKGMKQSELAEKAGISRVAVGNYERNERTPNVEILLKLANALDVPIMDLMNIPADDYNAIRDIAKKTKTHPAYITGKTKEKKFTNYYFDALIKDLNLEKFKIIVKPYQEDFQEAIFSLWANYLGNMLPECYYNDDKDSGVNSDPDFVVGEELDNIYIANKIINDYQEFRRYLSFKINIDPLLNGKSANDKYELDPDDLIAIYTHKEKLINNISSYIDETIKRYIKMPNNNSPLYGFEIMDNYGKHKEEK